MDKWVDLALNVLAEFIAFCFGVLAVWVYRGIFKVLPARLLWRLSKPERVMICVAASTRTYTGEYYRPATGIGQVRAMAILSSSLDAAYKGIDTKNIILSDEQLRTKIENDLILLGGPKNNEVTRDFLDKLQKLCVVGQTDQGICWTVGRTPSNYVPVCADEKVKSDYGLIIRTRSPYANKKTICLFSGGHTYGVVAASLYFTQHYRGIRNLPKIIKPTLIAVVSCDVQDDCPVNIRLVNEYTSWEPGVRS